MTRRGLFLVFEGVEGVGKSTQARLLSSSLGGRGISHTLGREPGGTPVGEAIRGVLLDSTDLEIAAEAELLLMLAARAAFVRQVVRPALARGEVMVSDRFELSTFAYQGVGRGLGLAEVRELNAFATGGLAPDLTLVFDLPVSEGGRRRRAAGSEDDRIEGAGAAFLEAVRQAYLDLAEGDSGVVVVDASASAEEIHARVWDLLLTRFPDHFHPEHQLPSRG